MIVPRLTAPWLESPATQSVFSALERGGYTVRAVGGIVRNTLLGLPATDIDIATNARPQDTLRLAADSGLKTIPTGLAHGTVTVMAAGVPFEVTTLRRDVATDGRHARVAFTDDWAADASRRDFTINALYCSRTGELFDPLGGAVDLSPVKIRFIGDPAQRIGEDYLRILRFFRFTATYCADGQLDAAGVSACAAHRCGLSRISGERIQAELLALLVARHARSVTEAVIESGVFAALFELSPRLSVMASLIALETQLGRVPDPVLRLGALCVATPDDAARLDRRLKLSARDRVRLAALPRLAGSIEPRLDESAVKLAVYRLGPSAYLDAVLLAWASSGCPADDAAFLKLATLPDRWTAPVFPVSGADIVALGVPPGPQIGVLLARLESEWMAAGFVGERADLLAQLHVRLKGIARPET